MKRGEIAGASKNGMAQSFGARPSNSIQGGLGKGGTRGLGKVFLVASQDGSFESFLGSDQGSLDGGGSVVRSRIGVPSGARTAVST